MFLYKGKQNDKTLYNLLEDVLGTKWEIHTHKKKHFSFPALEALQSSSFVRLLKSKESINCFKKITKLFFSISLSLLDSYSMGL